MDLIINRTKTGQTENDKVKDHNVLKNKTLGNKRDRTGSIDSGSNKQRN